MSNTTEQQEQGKHGFSSDFKQYYFRDLVFNVDFNQRRKRISIVFNRERCCFTLKLGHYPQWWTGEKMLQSIDIVLGVNYKNFQTLLHDNVGLSEIPSSPKENQYATGDIVYLYGLPYRLEVEYEMKPNYTWDGKRTQDSATITAQPQQLTLMMVPEDSSRYSGKFELLLEEGYYKSELLNELPVLVTQAAADSHNQWRIERLQELKRAGHDLKTMLQDQTGTVFSHSSEEQPYGETDNFVEPASAPAPAPTPAAAMSFEGIPTLATTSPAVSDSFESSSGYDAFDDDYYDEDWTSDSSIISTGYDLDSFDDDDDYQDKGEIVEVSVTLKTPDKTNHTSQSRDKSIQEGSTILGASVSGESAEQAASLQTPTPSSEQTETVESSGSQEQATDKLQDKSQNKSPLISEEDKLTLNLPLQAGLILPPRHMEFIKSVYLKRALLEYAWLFSLDQSSFEFDTLVRHYGSCIQFLSAKLYGDLWQALEEGRLCDNRYFLDADGAFLELFAGADTLDVNFDVWLTKQWARLCCLGMDRRHNRFYSGFEGWGSTYQEIIEQNHKLKGPLVMRTVRRNRGFWLHNEPSAMLNISAKKSEQDGKAAQSTLEQTEGSVSINYKSKVGQSEGEVRLTRDTSQESWASVSLATHEAKEPKEPASQEPATTEPTTTAPETADNAADVLHGTSAQTAVERELDEAERADLMQGVEHEQWREQLIKELMLEWYEGREKKIELRSEDLELNFALCPLLKREGEEQLLQSMVIGDQLQAQDIHLTADILGSQHWELTGPLRDRLLFKKQQSLSYVYPDDNTMRQRLTSPEYDKISAVILGCGNVYWNQVYPQWDMGRLDQLYVEHKFAEQEGPLKEYKELIASFNSNKAISWWPNNPAQSVDCSEQELRSRFYQVVQELRQGQYSAIRLPLKRLMVDRHFYEHFLYLTMNELIAEQDSARKVNELKQRNLNKAQAQHGQSVPSCPGATGGSTSQTQDSSPAPSQVQSHKGQQSLFDLGLGDNSTNCIEPQGNQECDDRVVEEGSSIQHDRAQGLFKTQFKRKDGINEERPILSFTGYAVKRHYEGSQSEDLDKELEVKRLTRLIESRSLAKGGEQYALCVDLDSELLDSYPELLFKEFGRSEGSATPSTSEQQGASEQQNADEQQRALREQVRGDLLLPHMCWTLGAGGEEIDPAEALPAHQDIFFPPERDINIELYEKVVGQPLLDICQHKSAKELGVNLALTLREENKFPHARWALRYWGRTLVRPGVIKVKVAYRNFKEFDSIKECQYRFDIIMRLMREQLTRQVLKAVKLFCPVQEDGEIAYLIEGAPSFISFTELKHKDVDETHPLQAVIYDLLDHGYFERCTISGGVTVQGRCTRGTLKVGGKEHFSQALTISQTLAAVPFSYTLSVVAHECCHLQIFDHSRAFKKLLSTICPFDVFLDSKWLEIKHLINVSPTRQRLGKLDVVRVGKE